MQSQEQVKNTKGDLSTSCERISYFASLDEANFQSQAAGWYGREIQVSGSDPAALDAKVQTLPEIVLHLQMQVGRGHFSEVDLKLLKQNIKVIKARLKSPLFAWQVQAAPLLANIKQLLGSLKSHPGSFICTDGTYHLSQGMRQALIDDSQYFHERLATEKFKKEPSLSFVEHKLSMSDLMILLGLQYPHMSEVTYKDTLQKSDNVTLWRLLTMAHFMYLPRAIAELEPLFVQFIKQLDGSDGEHLKVAITLGEQLNEVGGSKCIAEALGEVYSTSLLDDRTTSALDKFKNIQMLHLKLHEYHRAAVASFSQFSSVSVLKFSYMTLNRLELEAIRRLPIQTLSFSQCSFPDGLESLRGMPVKQLTLYACSSADTSAIRDRDLQVLASLPLVELDLSANCHITDVGIGYLQHLSLKSLQLDYCRQLSAKGFATLPKSLISLSLNSCDVTDETLQSLAHLSLTSLSLDRCHRLTCKGFLALSKLPLTSLRLTNCKGLTDESLEYLRVFPLQSLDLSNCPGLEGYTITGSGFAALKKLPLQTLDLSNQQGLVNLEALRFLPLTLLKCSGCQNLTNAHLAHLAKLPLAELDISKNRGIDDGGAEFLKDLPLKKLILIGTQITEHGRFRLQHLNPKIELFWTYGQPKK